MIAKTPPPPYFAVIFTSIKNSTDEGYQAMNDRMMDLAAKEPGFLGVESARNETGITVSYWKSEEDIINWKKNLEHLKAQQLGIESWYLAYTVRICKVEREYGMGYR